MTMKLGGFTIGLTTNSLIELKKQNINKTRRKGGLLFSSFNLLTHFTSWTLKTLFCCLVLRMSKLQKSDES
jgi:ABC-type polar amino acid transport system ATPase subunit